MVGIYTIKNTINNKVYIGSSINVEKRLKDHFINLSKNKHHNQHLQFAYNKYGKDYFTKEILETFEDIDRDDLFDIEKEYILKYKIENTYNIAIDTRAGGFESLKRDCFLLNLSGEIIETFESVIEASLFLGLKDRASTNSFRIIKDKYRLVTKEFYETELALILSWKKYKNIKDSFVKYYNYDTVKSKYIVTHNKEVIGMFKNEKDAIKVSKYLLKIDRNE
mgnify:CR=1 FL=1